MSRTMEGFGVHTFRLVNAVGDTSLVKFHWKPVAGTASLVWEEAQKLGGIDPDFHRRDLWDSIEAGAFPEWDFGIQAFPDSDDQTFEGIDLLDATKLVPEEIAPVQVIGSLTLNRNPTNYFAETEQVAFCTAHVPRGVDFTDDPLLQARNFSYLDTQLTRLGGPNFDQLPINRPHSPVNTTDRDGFAQQAVAEGVAAYNPNSVGGGCPFPAGASGYVHVPRTVTGARGRVRAQSFSDHYSQATLFWESMSKPEKDHIVAAFSFELGKCLHRGDQRPGLGQPGQRVRRTGHPSRRQPRRDGPGGHACHGHRTVTRPVDRLRRTRTDRRARGRSVRRGRRRRRRACRGARSPRPRWGGRGDHRPSRRHDRQPRRPGRGDQERSNHPSPSSTTPSSWLTEPMWTRSGRTPTSPSTWARPTAATRPSPRREPAERSSPPARSPPTPRVSSPPTSQSGLTPRLSSKRLDVTATGTARPSQPASHVRELGSGAGFSSPPSGISNDMAASASPSSGGRTCLSVTKLPLRPTRRSASW